VPPEAVEPLTTVGAWLAKHGECAYGKVDRLDGWGWGSGVGSLSRKGNTVYVWNWIWPRGGETILGGFTTPLKSVRLLDTGTNVAFTQEKYRIVLRNLPTEPPDRIAGVAVLALEFDGPPETVRFAARPPLNQGRIYG